jgi:DNA-binding response OmpR family regulator
LEINGDQIAKAYDGKQALTIAELFRPEIMLLDITCRCSMAIKLRSVSTPNRGGVM